MGTSNFNEQLYAQRQQNKQESEKIERMMRATQWPMDEIMEDIKKIKECPIQQMMNFHKAFKDTLVDLSAPYSIKQGCTIYIDKGQRKMYQLEMNGQTIEQVTCTLEEALKHAQDLSTRFGKPIEVLNHIHQAKPKAKPEPQWIPALVKWRDIPAWWRMKDIKQKLMGTVILVKELTKEEKDKSYWQADYNQDSLVEYKSIRKAEKPNRPSGIMRDGNWFWSKDDLILYPTKQDIEFANQVAYLASGHKRRPL